MSPPAAFSPRLIGETMARGSRAASTSGLRIVFVSMEVLTARAGGFGGHCFALDQPALAAFDEHQSFVAVEVEAARPVMLLERRDRAVGAFELHLRGTDVDFDASRLLDARPALAFPALARDAFRRLE